MPNKKIKSRKKIKHAGALFSGKKQALEPCSAGSFLKKSCGKGLTCVKMDDAHKVTKDGKTYDGYCAAEGTTPETVIGMLQDDKCKNVQCGDHGTCVMNGMDTSCECKDGYSGQNCEVAPDPCIGHDCGPHGECKNVNGVATCECKDGYTGEKCEIEPDPCIGHDCGPHGECKNVNGVATCECKDGYTGEKCEIEPDPCIGHDCGVMGKCVNVNGVPTCECINGYTGEKCEIPPNPCDNTDCGEHGTCENVNGEAKCNCEDGYNGDRCQFAPVTLESRGLSSLVAETPVQDLTNTAAISAHMRNKKNPNVDTSSAYVTGPPKPKPTDPTEIKKFCPPSTQNDPKTGKPIGHPCVRCCSIKSGLFKHAPDGPEPDTRLFNQYKECEDVVTNDCKAEYTWEELTHVEPMDRVREKLELRLNDKEFQEKFGMTKDAWSKAKDWKKNAKLKELKIFGGKRTKKNIKRNRRNSKKIQNKRIFGGKRTKMNIKRNIHTKKRFQNKKNLRGKRSVKRNQKLSRRK